MRMSVRLMLVLGASVALSGLGACAGGTDTPEPIGPVDPAKPTPVDTATPGQTVTGLPAGARVVFDSRLVEVNQGTSRQLTARVVDASGNTLKDIPLSFVTAGESPMTVSEDGLVTGVAPGAGVVQVKAGDKTVDSVDVDVFGHPDGLVLGSATLSMRPFGAAVSRQGVVFVTQLDANQMSITDVRSRSITGAIEVGSIPTGVTFSADGKTAYVTNQGSGNVGVVNVATCLPVARSWCVSRRRAGSSTSRATRTS